MSSHAHRTRQRVPHCSGRTYGPAATFRSRSNREKWLRSSARAAQANRPCSTYSRVCGRRHREPYVTTAASVVRHVTGYVPQDDVVHKELPLAATLRYAARLRLPRGTTSAEIEHAVRDALHSLELEHRADVKVGALSGGQRKRASIAAELLTPPRALFLDEPTSGLDPATSAGAHAHATPARRRRDDGRVHDPQHRRSRRDRPGRAPGARRVRVRTSAPLEDALVRFGATANAGIYERLSPTPARHGREARRDEHRTTPRDAEAPPVIARPVQECGRCSAVATSTC